MRAATLVLLACLAALPAGADWLVMRDGTHVETRGVWKERGRVVVFTSADGQLVSLRADAVDLAASRRATEAAAEAAARPAEERAAAAAPRPTSRRITNADIPTGRTPRAAAETGEDGETAPAAPRAAGAADLQVRDTAQQIDPIDGHLVVTGTLANVSARTAAAVELLVEAHGADGALLGSQAAVLGMPALGPGAATGFEAHFLDVYGGAMALRFAPAASFLETQPQDAARTSAGETDDGFDDPDGAP